MRETVVANCVHPLKAFPLRGRWHGIAVTDEVLNRYQILDVRH